MRKTVALVLGLLLYVASFAQKNLKEGYVVLNNKDTLAGFIDYREWYKNPDNILFSSSKDENMQHYKVRDISAFAVNDKEMYRRYVVRISMDRQLVGNIGEKDTSYRTDTVFLKVLQTGNNVALFSYSDGIKKRWYILPANGSTPVELRNSEYIQNGEVVNEEEYRAVLLSIARRYVRDVAGIQTSIYNLKYTQSDIISVCSLINGISQTTLKQELKDKPSDFRFFAGIGVHRGEITISGDSYYAGITKGANYGPIADAGVDLFVNPAVGRLYLRSQLTASAYKTEAYTFKNYFEAKENYYLTFSQRNIGLHELLNYNVYNGQQFKWFIGAGAGANFSSYPKNEELFIREGLRDTTSSVNTNYAATIRKFWLNAVCRTGFTIPHFDIALAYYPKSSLSQSAAVFYNTSLQLQVDYLFSK